MNLRAKIFGKTFFEIESVKPVIESKETEQEKEYHGQMEYLITDIQYQSLVEIRLSIEQLAHIRKSDFDNQERMKYLTDCYVRSIEKLNNIIGSYEHFKEKRDQLGSEQPKSNYTIKPAN